MLRITNKTEKMGFLTIPAHPRFIRTISEYITFLIIFEKNDFSLIDQ